jgi:hypothetical protein
MSSEYFINCNDCNKIIQYKTIVSFNVARKRLKVLCRSCATKLRESNYRKLGMGSSFSGKKHSQESIEKMKRNFTTEQGENRRKNIAQANKGMNNVMYGKSYFDVWVEKYGLDEANKRLEKWKINQKNNTLSSINNPMYGKSYFDVWVEKYGLDEANKRKADLSKKLSINFINNRKDIYDNLSTLENLSRGWSGWYKGYFFRSLKELSYMIDLDKKGISWQSAEHISISYKDNNINRQYHPDFLVNENIIVEIKPKRLMNSIDVKLKKEAAEKYCLENGLKYILTDFKNLSEKELFSLRENNQIKFTERYEKKYIERYESKK